MSENVTHFEANQEGFFVISVWRGRGGDNSQRGQAERMWVSDMGGGALKLCRQIRGPVAQSSGSPSLAILQTQLWVPGPFIMIEACLYPFINTEMIQ